MKLSPVVLKLRESNILPFEQNIAGAAEFGSVKNDTLETDTAYVVQLTDIARANDIEGDVTQELREGFGVIVAIKNDKSQAEKTGVVAYDSLHEIRKQLYDVLVGWQIPDDDDECGYYQENPIYYKGGSIIDINPAWLWYQFEFEFKARITRTEKDLDLDDFNTISTQYVITPNAQIPIIGAKSLPSAIAISDLEQIIDLTENLTGGAFIRGFDAGFDLLG